MSLQKAGQRVFRWTEPGGAAMNVSDALGQHGHLGTLTLLWLSLLIQCVHARIRACFHCHFDISVHDTRCHPGNYSHVLIKPLMQLSVRPKRASISYNP